MTLPEYVSICPLCKGEGSMMQDYCDGPNGRMRLTGPCDMCWEPGSRQRGRDYYSGAGLVYRATGKPVGDSVIEQVRSLNP